MSHCVSVGVSALPAPTPFSCSYLIKSSLRQWRDPHSRKSESTLYGSTRNVDTADTTDTTDMTCTTDTTDMDVLQCTADTGG